MQAYGRRKHHTPVAGHQECGICHPVQKSKTTRARREGRKETVMARPNYKRAAQSYKEQALSFHHSEVCGPDCSCQEYEQSMWKDLQKELGRPLLDEEMDP